jgi:acetyl-CoA decarbonylase/synthase complex subunit gamma
VAIGAGVRAFKIGGETVMFRHEKTFYSPTGIAALVTSDTDAGALDKKLKEWNAFQYERVGLNLRPELVALKDVNGNAAAFAAAAKKIAEESEFNLVLMSDKADVMKAAVDACAFKKPLMYAATAQNAEAMGKLAKEKGLPLAVKADNLQNLMALSDKLTAMGLKDLVLDSGSRDPKQVLQDQVAIRRAPLKAGNRSLGFRPLRSPVRWRATWTWKRSWRPCSSPSTRGSWCFRISRERACFPCFWNGSTSTPTRRGP